ncbi:GCN5-related N-acetyltransferase (GNAT) domain-containing protein [Pochonia chlamydosporia 170]|uniref:GCN5-related N-acetyltransferase (GNAT) domain-containing protein n=1 Tax=Pochonia chlamydosporia 170 TaxID=1380566 RepID=A0A179F725_METCM|nr:GCN5-related N-acetyltransferase (GNAT) domain-containing protein [Pochonia chlamydosporia 170]OAQ61264.1 GCN5-related N-acetyltransferase (GNAT) domain-containing protein [Pochonia chlamydosporia 170]
MTTDSTIDAERGADSKSALLPLETQASCTRIANSEQAKQLPPNPFLTRAPAEELVEEDLVLRRWQLSDAQALNTAASGSVVELARWMPWAADGYDLTKAYQFLEFADKAWNNGDEYNFAIIVDGQPCGSFGLMTPVTNAPNTLEIGYWLANEATGRGLATRATALLRRIAFEIGAEHVQIRHDQRNSRSGAIPRRLGFNCLGLYDLPSGKGGQDVKSLLWQKDRCDELQ